MNGPDALAFDGSGNLYVGNFIHSTVSRFTPGGTTPSATLTGVESPDALAFDSSGNLYVANGTGSTVSKVIPQPFKVNDGNGGNNYTVTTATNTTGAITQKGADGDGAHGQQQSIRFDHNGDLEHGQRDPGGSVG